MKICIGDTVEINACGPKLGIVRHIGILMGYGENDSVWSEWEDHFTGMIPYSEKNGCLTYMARRKCTLISKGEKMGKIVAEYPSKSHPGKMYHVTLPNSGGELYCDCWAWKRNRKCMHLDEYQSGAGVGLAPLSGGGEIKYETRSDFDIEISNAVLNIINK